MTVTVSGKNYSQIESCDTTGGTWSITEEVDGDNYKEGAGSLSFTMKNSGTNDNILSGISVNFTTGSSHLRFWFMDAAPGLLTDSDASVAVGISDGTNTGYYNLNAQRYTGGWKNMVVDTARAVDSGTKPTNMNAITSITFRIIQSAGGKNFDNVWIDNVCKSDGLIIYGDDGGGYMDFEDVFTEDDGTLGHGIITKFGGIYYLAGSLEFGDSASTNGCKFQAKSQIVVIEDRPISASLCDFNIVDNGTGTTEFILGDKSGTAGIQGCVIRVASASQTAKFSIDGKTDTDVDNFKLYGTTFYGASTIEFPASSANVEILSCSFELCGQIDPNSASVTKCFFINTSDADAAVLWNESIALTYSNFIANTTGAAIEMPSAVGTPYSYTGLYFSGNTYDVLNSSGSAITINKAGTPASDPSTYEGSTVTFLASVTIEITVKDKDGNLLTDVQTAVYKTSDRTELLNEDTVSGVASDTYSGSTPVEVEVRCRKASSGSTKYVNYSSTQTVSGSGLTLSVTMIEDLLNAT